MDELLPCPFCGGTNLLVCDPDRWAGESFWHVDCQAQGCGVEGPYDLGKSGAVAKWNMRADAQLAALRTNVWDAIDDLSNPAWQHGGYALGVPDGVSLKWVEGVVARLRESCPRYGADDGPDALEDA